MVRECLDESSLRMTNSMAEAGGIRETVSLAYFLQTNIPFTRTKPLARHITDRAVF